jgi:hypothetical protein
MVNEKSTCEASGMTSQRLDETSVNKTISVLVPVGSLGVGVRVEEVKRGIAAGADVIALDAGSTDSGAAYLATGVAKYNREAIKRDLLVLMAAQAEAGIPLLIGSCGQSGNDIAVSWVRDIAVEVAAELDISPRIAVLYSEQDPRALKAQNARGRIRPLAPAGPLTDATIDRCAHIVAMMGPEPYMAALRAGADIVLGGRTTDTAVLAAVPLMRGAGIASSWHAGKIGECGGQCAVNSSGAAGVLMRIGSDSFEIEPLSPTERCDVRSVSGHMLYENSNPFRLTEPGGVLDVTTANYQPVDERTVRVTGSRWEAMPYTMKLEGAGPGPFQTIMIIGIEDPEVLASLDLFHDRLHAALIQRIEDTFGNEAGEYDISLRFYGWNAVSGVQVPKGTAAPREVGVLFVASASTQSLATRMAKACNPYFFHFPLNRGKDLPSYAFPFSPSEVERGPVYLFHLNHVVTVDDPLELVRTEWLDLGVRSGAIHG